MIRWLVSIAVLSSLSACAVVELTPAEKGDLAVAMKSPLTFEMGKEESAAAWGRAQVFLFKHSRIKTISEFVIDAGKWRRYTAERLPLADGRYRITLAREPYSQESPAQKEQREQDAHVFAHFVQTGELACARNEVSACVSPQEVEWVGYTPVSPLPAATLGQ